MEKACCKENRKTVLSDPVGLRALGQGFDVEVDADAVVEYGCGEILADVIVGGEAQRGRRYEVRGRGFRRVGSAGRGAQGKRRRWAHADTDDWLLHWEMRENHKWKLKK